LLSVCDEVGRLRRAQSDEHFGERVFVTFVKV
jgi:hypothetical protein